MIRCLMNSFFIIILLISILINKSYLLINLLNHEQFILTSKPFNFPSYIFLLNYFLFLHFPLNGVLSFQFSFTFRQFHVKNFQLSFTFRLFHVKNHLLNFSVFQFDVIFSYSIPLNHVSLLVSFIIVHYYSFLNFLLIDDAPYHYDAPHHHQKKNSLILIH